MGRKMKAFTLASLIFLSIHTEAVAATIFAPAACDVLIFGELKNGDEKKFRATMQQGIRQGCVFPKVTIYSPGGSLSAAIAIGEDIRRIYAVTAAPNARNVMFDTGAEPEVVVRRCPMIVKLPEERSKYLAEKKREDKAWERVRRRRRQASTAFYGFRKFRPNYRERRQTMRVRERVLFYLDGGS